MTLKEYLKNHSIRVLAIRTGVSESSIRRYKDFQALIPLSIALRIEIATKSKVKLTDMITADQKVELREVKSEMNNLHKPRVILIDDLGEDLL